MCLYFWWSLLLTLAVYNILHNKKLSNNQILKFETICTSFSSTTFVWPPTREHSARGVGGDASHQQSFTLQSSTNIPARHACSSGQNLTKCFCSFHSANLCVIFILNF